jgi:hypothetical protein
MWTVELGLLARSLAVAPRIGSVVAGHCPEARPSRPVASNETMPDPGTNAVH